MAFCPLAGIESHAQPLDQAALRTVILVPAPPCPCLGCSKGPRLHPAGRVNEAPPQPGTPTPAAASLLWGMQGAPHEAPGL